MSEDLISLIERLANEHSAIVERLGRIERDIIHLDEMAVSLKMKLFGNGQPGVIDLISVRITEIEKWVWRVTGITSAALAAINLFILVVEVLREWR